MTSLRKRVSSYFRQLSFHNEPRERKSNINENNFVMKYLTGQIKLREGPPVLHGKSPNDLPNYELDIYTTGASSIVGCATGPNGGLTTVRREEKHLDIPDPDIDFIDTQEENAGAEVKSKSPKPSNKPLDNSTMIIKVAGQEYKVTNTKRKSCSLGSLNDLTSIENNDKTNDISDISIPNNNNSETKNCDEKNVIKIQTISATNNENSSKSSSKVVIDDNNKSNKENLNKNFALSKSKSEINPFEHRRKGKIIRLTERPKAQEETENTNNTNVEIDDKLPKVWNRKTDYVFGVSDSLYDVNQVTKCKNGNPIADCFGVIARTDSSILALADGVNWGEKACLAAKSAVHGCLHYLNKTIFDDVSIFELEKTDQNSFENPRHHKLTQLKTTKDIEKLTEFSLENNENRISNTMEVFICLLRAFNCAHNLILENQGMLTTLTVAVVLPLKNTNFKKITDTVDGEVIPKSPRPHSVIGCGPNSEKYVCCVCNVGDTLAYIYSQKYGVREITKGSHDVLSNRDMRDALGALGPVDGINPELNNLTLSLTILEAGDIVMVASDGLTDNYDPTVCKFTVNASDKPQKPSSHAPHSHRDSKRTPHQPKNPQERERKPSASSKPTTRPQSSNRPSNVVPPSNRQRQVVSRINKENKKASQENVDVDVIDNPLVAQFMKDNALDRKTSEPNKPSQKEILSTKQNENKMLPLMKSSSTGVFKSNKITLDTNPDQPSSKYNFLRSKTSLEMRPEKVIPRNEEGLPYVSPMQKYEIQLLLMEDILKRGISGRERQCTTAKNLCENLYRYTISITAAKRHTLEDVDLYYDNRNDIMVEISQREKKIRRRKCLEKVQNLPGKLDHVSIVACNVGNRVILPT